jgi:hypothetical protein
MRYPRPPITLAGLFRPPPDTEQPPELPVWWPNDKQLVLTYRRPPVSLTADPEDLR